MFFSISIVFYSASTVFLQHFSIYWCFASCTAFDLSGPPQFSAVILWKERLLALVYHVHKATSFAFLLTHAITTNLKCSFNLEWLWGICRLTLHSGGELSTWSSGASKLFVEAQQQTTLIQIIGLFFFWGVINMLLNMKTWSGLYKHLLVWLKLFTWPGMTPGYMMHRSN